MGYRTRLWLGLVVCLWALPALAEDVQESCEPQCADKACGDDGCGDVCGTCPDGEECVEGENGTTACEEVCVPDCEGKTCGGDGCGGGCGECDAGDVCLNDNCIFAECEGSCEAKAESGCFCDASCFQFGDCCEDICVTCGICGAADEGGGTPDGCGQGTSCEGCCGVFSYEAPCQCDDSCPVYDDCCSDACELCGACEDESPEEACPEWLSYAGCCRSESEISYCSSTGVMQGGPCPDDLVCGWNVTGEYYDCVEEASTDPSGEFPLFCEDVAGYEPPVEEPESGGGEQAEGTESQQEDPDTTQGGDEPDVVVGSEDVVSDDSEEPAGEAGGVSSDGNGESAEQEEETGGGESAGIEGEQQEEEQGEQVGVSDEGGQDSEAEVDEDASGEGDSPPTLESNQGSSGGCATEPSAGPFGFFLFALMAWMMRRRVFS